MYKESIAELKSKFTTLVLNAAMRKWRESIPTEDIPAKVDSLQQLLEGASKKEFIKVYEYYVMKGERPSKT